MFWKPISAVRKAAQVPYIGPNKRQKYSYICNRCGGTFSAKEINIHHTIPCGTLTRAEDLPGFVTRLFCEKDQLECICLNCHDKAHLK